MTLCEGMAHCSYTYNDDAWPASAWTTQSLLPERAVIVPEAYMFEAAMVGHAAAAVILELPENVFEAGGGWLARWNREAEAHSLPIIVVGVLT